MTNRYSLTAVIEQLLLEELTEEGLFSTCTEASRGKNTRKLSQWIKDKSRLHGNHWSIASSGARFSRSEKTRRQG